MNKSRSRKVNRVQSVPQQLEWEKDDIASVQKAKCPYKIEQFETFKNTRKRDDGPIQDAYLIFTRNPSNNRVGVRLSLPPDMVDEMHKCMDFGEYLEYRINKTARVIALMPGPYGVKLSLPSRKQKTRGDRRSMSMYRAKDMLCDMFGYSQYVYLMAEYYDGVVILRPTGETEGTVDPEQAQ